MPNIRFEQTVFCPSCGRDTKVTPAELADKMNFSCPCCRYPIKKSEPEAKPEAVNKVCPFRFIGFKVNPQGTGMTCVKENCGVWSTEHKCCGFAAISKHGWSGCFK